LDSRIVPSKEGAGLFQMLGLPELKGFNGGGVIKVHIVLGDELQVFKDGHVPKQ